MLIYPVLPLANIVCKHEDLSPSHLLSSVDFLVSVFTYTITSFSVLQGELQYFFVNFPRCPSWLAQGSALDLARGNESFPKNVEFLDNNKNIKTLRRINLTYTEKFQAGTERSWWHSVLILVLSAFHLVYLFTCWALWEFCLSMYGSFFCC